jgi:hypothetical protein
MNARIIDAGIVLQEICPHGEWDIKNNDYDTLIWGENNPVSKPTKKEYTDKLAELTAAEPMRLLKEERNRRIAESDWRFLSDQTPSQAWIDYRQALRDLPANSIPELDENDNLINVNWPVEPTE